VVLAIATVGVLVGNAVGVFGLAHVNGQVGVPAGGQINVATPSGVD
jgi:hypothetical protein